MLVLTCFNTRKCDEMNQHHGTMDVMDVTTKNMLFHHGKKGLQQVFWGTLGNIRSETPCPRAQLVAIDLQQRHLVGDLEHGFYDSYRRKFRSETSDNMDS